MLINQHSNSYYLVNLISFAEIVPSSLIASQGHHHRLYNHSNFILPQSKLEWLINRNISISICHTFFMHDCFENEPSVSLPKQDLNRYIHAFVLTSKLAVYTGIMKFSHFLLNMGYLYSQIVSILRETCLKADYE